VKSFPRIVLIFVSAISLDSSQFIGSQNSLQKLQTSVLSIILCNSTGV